MGNKQGGHAQDGHSGDAVDPSELEYQDKLAAGALEADRAQDALAKALAAAGGLIGDGDDDVDLGGVGDGGGEEGEEAEEGEEDVELTEADLKDPALLKALKDLGGNVSAVAAPPSRADMAALAKRLIAGGGSSSEQARRFVARRIVANERTVAAVQACSGEGGDDDEETSALLAVYTEKRNRFLEDACDLEEGEETVVVPEDHGMTAEVMAEMMALGWEAPKASAKPAASFVLSEEVSGAVEKLDGVVSVEASALSDKVVRNEKEVFGRRARAIELKKAGKTPEAKAEAKAMTEGQALRKRLLEEAAALWGAAEEERAKAEAAAEAEAAKEEAEKAAAAAAKAAAEKPVAAEKVEDEAPAAAPAAAAAAAAAAAPTPAKPLSAAAALLPQLDARAAAADAAGDAASAEAARGHAATLSALVAEVRAAREEAKGASGMVQMRLLRTIKAADAPLTEAAAAARDELAKEITAKPAAPAVDAPAVAALRRALLLLVDCHRATALERTDGVVRFTKEAEKAVRMLRGATEAGGGVAAPDALEATVAQMRKTVAPLAGEAAAEGYEEADVVCCRFR